MGPPPRKIDLNAKNDPVGPASYNPKPIKTTPHFTFGMNFGSDILSQDHIKPKKVDGPGPGSYGAKSSFEIKKSPGK